MKKSKNGNDYQINVDTPRKQKRGNGRPIVELTTDSTIAPPQNQRFSLTNVSWLLDTRKDAMKRISACITFVCGGLSNDDVRVVRGTVFQEIRPGAGFKTGDFVKEKLGGLP